MSDVYEEVYLPVVVRLDEEGYALSAEVDFEGMPWPGFKDLGNVWGPRGWRFDIVVEEAAVEQLNDALGALDAYS